MRNVLLHGVIVGGLMNNEKDIRKIHMELLEQCILTIIIHDEYVCIHNICRKGL